MVRAGLKAIYLSGWQVAADANTAGAMYPDQSLYPANAGPGAVPPHQPHAASAPTRSSIPKAAPRRDWFAPIVADAEAGFGGPLNCFEIMKAYIEAGAAGVHFEDQLASEKKCGHLGGKVLIPTRRMIRNLDRGAARRRRLRRADPRRRPHRRRERQADHLRRRRARPRVHHRRAHRRRLLPPEGRHRPRPLHRARPRLRAACRPAVVGDRRPRTSTRRKQFAEAVQQGLSRARCSPTIARQSSTGKPSSTRRRSPSSSASSARWATSSSSSRWPASTASTTACSSWRAATRPRHGGLFRAAAGRVRLARSDGYTATRHQREVGTGYFDLVSTTITGGKSSTTALHESTEAAQFKAHGSDIRVQAAE